MRTRYLLTSTFTTAAVAAVLFSGCGSTSNDDGKTDASTADTGTSNQDATPKETGPDRSAPVDAGEVCETDADLKTLQVPDASIGNTGATTGSCMPCIKGKCGTDLDACNAECACKLAIIELFDCVSGGGSLLSCGSGLVNGGGQSAQGLGLCILNSCDAECGVSALLDGGRDGAKDGAGDSQTDAPADTGGGG